MDLKKLTGPQAGSLKYDLLTALSVAGLRGGPTLQTSMMRLSAMVTARYNWRLDEISIGQEELARIWAVNPRTVKREMKRLMADGWLVCLRPGVRGRVGAYRLHYARLYQNTRDSWGSVGPDFVARMDEMAGTRTVVNVDFTKPALKPELKIVPEPGLWGAVMAHLRAGHPEMCESWYGQLTCETDNGRDLHLIAPNRFVAAYIEMHLMAPLLEAITNSVKSTGHAMPKVHIQSKS